MTEHAERLVSKVGCIDAVLFFVTWLCMGLIAASHPWGALPAVVFLLLPASALVGWRGAVSVRLILAGTDSLRRAGIEGFGWGAAFVLVIVLWSAANSASAAGSAFDGLSPLQAEFWC
jgi:hypothetical protein